MKNVLMVIPYVSRSCGESEFFSIIAKRQAHSVHRACLFPGRRASRRFIGVGDQKHPLVPHQLCSATYFASLSTLLSHESVDSRISKEEIAISHHIRNVQLVPLLARRECLGQTSRLYSLFIVIHCVVLFLSLLEELDPPLHLFCIDRPEVLIDAGSGLVVARGRGGGNGWVVGLRRQSASTSSGCSPRDTNKELRKRRNDSHRRSRTSRRHYRPVQ